MSRPLFDPADFGFYSERDFEYFLKSGPALVFGLNKYQQKLEHAQSRLEQVKRRARHERSEQDRQFWASWTPWHEQIVSDLAHRVDYLRAALALLTEHGDQHRHTTQEHTGSTVHETAERVHGC